MSAPRDFAQMPPRRHHADPWDGPHQPQALDRPLFRLVCAVAIVVWMYVIAYWLSH